MRLCDSMVFFLSRASEFNQFLQWKDMNQVQMEASGAYIEEAENIVAKKTSCKIFFNQKTVAVHARKTKFMQMHLYLNLI